MIIKTSLGACVSVQMLANYFDRLIDKIFKILPIIEHQELTIDAYLDNLESEIYGLNQLLPLLRDDPLFISMLSKLRWLIDNARNPESNFKKIRREVFNTISICKSLKEHYLTSDDIDAPEVISHE